MSPILGILAVIASLLTGYWLFLQFQGGGHAVYDAIATASATFWVFAGIFAILGGFVIFGAGLVVLFSYVALSKGSRTKRRLRRRIAG